METGKSARDKHEVQYDFAFLKRAIIHVNCIFQPFRGLNATRQTASGSNSSKSKGVTIHHMVNNRQAPVSLEGQQQREKETCERHSKKGHTCRCVREDSDSCGDNNAILPGDPKRQAVTLLQGWNTALLDPGTRKENRGQRLSLLKATSWGPLINMQTQMGLLKGFLREQSKRLFAWN